MHVPSFIPPLKVLLRFYLSIFWYLCIIFCQNNPLKGCQKCVYTTGHRLAPGPISLETFPQGSQVMPGGSGSGQVPTSHLSWVISISLYPCPITGSSRFQVGAIGTMIQNDIPTWSSLICPTLLRHMLTTQNSKTCFWKCMENALKMWNTSKIKIWNTTHRTQFLTLVLGSSSAAEIGCNYVCHSSSWILYWIHEPQ